ISGVLGVIFLWDWLSAWNVAATWSQPWLVLLLVATLVLGQVLYAAVARHDGRPIVWPVTLLFALGNGFFETLAFALSYRLGEVLGHAIASLVAPQAASGLGFALGIVGFVIFGGLIHGLFWLKLLPPHLDDSPRARAIRKRRPLAEIALVLVWSLCFWLYTDIWTVIFFHILVDFFLMLFVRPPFLSRPDQTAPHP
ncbi:MAG: hypothetical protein MUD01_14690, partial [Chloroflexaceae bacterium]|nr:hypothetical protein [Chloroflexaceae bacterium]